jgi:1,4-alpha-glucan branching enzyme
MSKRVTIQNDTSSASGLREVGSAPKPGSRRKAAKASPQSSTPPTRVSSERLAAAGQQSVRFELFDRNAREAFLVGTFNDWQPGLTPLINPGDGNWAAELKLKPGTYEYRFIVDGRWTEDLKSSRFATNPFGGVNSVLEVGEQSGTGAPADGSRRRVGSPRRASPNTRSWSVKPSTGNYWPEGPNR